MATKTHRAEIRWLAGERVYKGWYTPGLFVVIHALVVGWMHLARAIGERWPKRGA